MTLKSNNAFLEVVTRRGGLIRFEPIAADPDKGEIRCVLLHPQVARRIDIKSSSLKRPKLLAIHDQLNAFIQGRSITVCVPPPDEDCDLKCLRDRDRKVWEIRFRAHMSERMLGIVPMKDVFLGLVMKPRNEFDGSRFAPNANRCLTIWDGFSGSSKPSLITGDDVSAAFSNWRVP